MSDNFVLHVKKFMHNPLLCRRQFMLEVLHPGKGNVTKNEIKGRLAKMYKVRDPQTIILFGFKTVFGGGRTKGFGMIYHNIASVKKFEKKYRLIRAGLLEKTVKTGRRANKELKNKKKKVRGTAKAKVSGAKKK